MKSFLKPSPEMRNGFKDPKRLAAVRSLRCCICAKFDLPQLTATEAHHRIGNGIGLKASDLLTFGLCRAHHTSGGKGVAIHETPLREWEEKFDSQDNFIEATNNLLKDL